ncbi:unnamed protein product [Danaus chrysippus]|uniref:(African queen) hypothetical protein n=1 Tax=Danaus chrysippus TaxID=151541 RepID=A0A8J2QLU9_9NEOP|nr:unnamed protein product [Danaus chrysippus]
MSEGGAVLEAAARGDVGRVASLVRAGATQHTDEVPTTYNLPLIIHPVKALGGGGTMGRRTRVPNLGGD